MSSEEDQTRDSRARALSAFCEYVLCGNHAFLACDDSKVRNNIVVDLQDTLVEEPAALIDCEKVNSLTEFSISLSKSCERLVSTLGIRHFLRYRFRDSHRSIASNLQDAMNVFCANERQGYLILNNIDKVVNMQHGMEIEGPLRSVMQLQHDIAVILFGSTTTVNMLIGDSHRPFYLSFRCFRL